MPSLIDIRRRVRAVKSTQQITKAMKMVSASKLRRAQERIVDARPYARKMLRVLNSIADRVDPSAHPLLRERPASGAPHAADRDHRRPRPVRQLQHQRREGRHARSANESTGARRWRWRWSAARAATSSAAAASTCATRTSACSARQASHAQAIAARAIEEFTDGRVSVGLSRLQRVQERDDPAASWSSGCCRSRGSTPRPAAPIARRARLDYLYEPSPERSSASCCRSTWRARSSARCSSRRRRSTPRA